MKLISGRALIVVGAALALGMGGGIAVAQIPSADGTITACFVKSTGVVRVIDADTTNCKKGETKLVWTQKGAPGADGADGTDGTDGVSGYEIVTKEQPETAFAFFGSVSVDCPTGKSVTGGGALATTASGGVQDGYKVINSSPKDTTGWRATFDISNPLNDPFVLKVYAMCAVMTP